MEAEFGMKDSGKREQMSTGAVRDTREGKGRFDLIPPMFLRRLAMVYEQGAKKYAARNWEKGMPLSRCFDSALRHLNQAAEGKEDEDHLGHAAFNIAAIMFFLEGVRAGRLPKELVDLPYGTDPKFSPTILAPVPGWPHTDPRKGPTNRRVNVPVLGQCYGRRERAHGRRLIDQKINNVMGYAPHSDY